MDIKISIIDICYATLMYEKFNKNSKVEKLTKKLGRGVRLIVIDPFETKVHFLISWK